MKRLPFDPDRDPRLRVRHEEPGFDGLSLFAVEASAAAWPQAPAAGDEQRTLPVEGTLEGAYRAWRDSDDGRHAWGWLVCRATELVAQGANRLSIGQLAEAYRMLERRSLNNSHRALLVRDLEDAYPALRGLFETRQRKAS